MHLNSRVDTATMSLLHPRQVNSFQPQLCEGRQTTTLQVMNDYQYPLRMEVKVPGAGWKNMGIIDPSNRTSFWRKSGEMWRLRDPKTNGVLVQRTTGPSGVTNLYAGRSQRPLTYEPMYRHRM